MHKFLKVLLLLTTFSISQICFADSNYEDLKKNIFVLYNTNKLKEAYQFISNIPEEQRDSDIWLLAANITADYDRDMDALFLYQKAISVDKNNYKAFYNLGNLYLNTKKYNSAINTYKECLKIKKDFSYAWYNLGNAYLCIEEYQKAKSAFMRAISFNTTEADFYYNLAYTYKKLNNQKQSLKMLKIYNTLIAEK
jgi:tetratricopeptide (TPR) repeat protein